MYINHITRFIYHGIYIIIQGSQRIQQQAMEKKTHWKKTIGRNDFHSETSNKFYNKLQRNGK